MFSPNKFLYSQDIIYIYIYCIGLFTLKTKYDESDNVVIRASRVVTDKLTDLFSKSS